MSKRRHDGEDISIAPVNTDKTADIISKGTKEDGSFVIDDIYIAPPPEIYCNLIEKGPRLIVTSIRNSFFKSYGEQVTLGPFNKCFNAIVGPNGSGKSNVIESILFVFGYRANRMRQKKMSMMIHKSENYQNIQSCKVTVHFQQIIDKQGSVYDVVPNSEITVARVIGLDGSSYYELNGRKVLFNQVSTLLKGHGVDLDNNRFLILQGEVEEIAMMKCKGANESETGMLEYLEDVIGTKRYIEPLKTLNERIEIIAEQRMEKLNRVNLVQKELSELEEPMQEAVGFLELENKISTQKNLIFQKKVRDLERHNDDVEIRKVETEEQLTTIQEKLSTLQTTRKEKEAYIEERSKKYAQMEKKRDDMKDAFNRANSTDIKLQAEMTQINQTRKRNKTLLVEERKKLENLLALPEKNAKSIKECEAKLETLYPKKQDLEEKKTELMGTLSVVTRELQGKKEVLQTKLIGLKKAVDETKAAHELSEFERKMYTSAEDTEQKKLETLQEQLKTATTTFKSRKDEVQRLKRLIPEKEQSLRESKQTLAQIKQQDTQMVADIRHKRSKFEEARSSMQANKSRGRVLDSLMQQKREGNCDGLFGRLGDLGAIDQKYDVAISTACGPLDNIVVDTTDTAKWCIDYLKKYDIGRATFIALDKQEYLRGKASSRINTPENVPRLFDLIRVEDERFKTAFYYGLSNTLVADNLDQASRIAYGAQRYRVVTLEGALIETTGTMSGGGRTVSRGRMGQKVRVSLGDPREMQNLEADIAKLDQNIAELRRSEQEHQHVVATLEPELHQMRISLERYTLELRNLEEQCPMLKSKLPAQEAKARETKADPKQIAKLQKVIDAKQADFDKAQAAADELQVDVDKITAEIKAKSTDKVKALAKSIKDVTKNIDNLKAEITKLSVAIKSSERNVKKTEEKIEGIQEDIKKAEQKLLQMKAQRDEIEADAAKLLPCIEELTIALQEGEEEYADVKTEVKEIAKQENKIKASKIEVDEKMKAIKKELLEIKHTIDKWTHRLRELKLQDIPNRTIDPLVTYTAEELDAKDIHNTQRELQTNEQLIKSSKPNLTVIGDYLKQRAVYVERSKELDAITEKKKHMHSVQEAVKCRRKNDFMTGYTIIKKKLKEMYQMITLGGDADFEFVDTFDPFSEGIQFNVRPPKKSWKQISNLSGGEKTLSSLALVFALHHYNPSPIYVMDEIDAALDFKNVSIIGNYIKEHTKNAQFLIISLRTNMFELCDYMIGIYKTYNCTKALSFDPSRYGDKPPTRMVPFSGAMTQNTQSTILPTTETPSQVIVPGKENQNPPVNNNVDMSETLENNDNVNTTLVPTAQGNDNSVNVSVIPATQENTVDMTVIPSTQGNDNSVNMSVIPSSQDDVNAVNKTVIPHVNGINDKTVDKSVIPGTQDQTNDVSMTDSTTEPVERMELD